MVDKIVSTIITSILLVVKPFARYKTKIAIDNNWRTTPTIALRIKRGVVSFLKRILPSINPVIKPSSTEKGKAIMESLAAVRNSPRSGSSTQEDRLNMKRMTAIKT